MATLSLWRVPLDKENSGIFVLFSHPTCGCLPNCQDCHFCGKALPGFSQDSSHSRLCPNYLMIPQEEESPLCKMPPKFEQLLKKRRRCGAILEKSIHSPHPWNADCFPQKAAWADRTPGSTPYSCLFIQDTNFLEIG